jgi:hypothetical protein
MPNQEAPTNQPEVIVDPAKHNAEIAAKVKDQDISGHSTATGQFEDARESLDKLAELVSAKKAEVKPAVGTPPAEVKPAAGTPPAEVKPAAGTPPAEVTPVDDPELVKKADTIFKDAPKLPPNASPKSAEAFSTVKVRAAQEISAREQEIERLKKQLEESGKPTPEALEHAKELEELRSWRAKVDVDFDPKFKEFDKSIEQTREFIYAQLQKNPAVTPEIIEQIKKYGGPDQIILTKLFEAIKDPTLQRLVEAKVSDIELAKYNREQAIKTTKENLGQYVKERQEAQSKAVVAQAQATTAELTGMLDRLEWFADQTPDEKADEAAKKHATEHNEFIKKLRGEIAVAVKDDSPQMRAILITGMAQLFKLQREMPAVKSELEATKKSLADITAKWDAMKNASRSRLNESAAPTSGIPPARKDVDINQRTEDAVDTIARQVMEERARAQEQK